MASEFLPGSKLKELVAATDKHLVLDEDAVQVVQDAADDFVDSVAAFACELARHRAGTMLEAKDVQLAIEKNWNLRLAGLDGGTELKVIKKTTTTNVHRQRQNQVREHKGEARRVAAQARR